VLMRFIYMIAWRFWNGSLFHHFSIFFKYIFENISSLDEPSVVFFALDRFSVNARFLARFIAKKLKQNYRVWELMSPIRKELNRARGISGASPEHFFKRFRGAVSKEIYTYRQGFYKRFLSYIFLLSRVYRYRYFLISKSPLFVDTLISHQYSFSIFNKFSKINLFNWAFIFDKNSFGLNLFFYRSTSHLADSLFSAYKVNRPVKLLNYYDFFSLIIKECYSNFNIATLSDFIFEIEPSSFVFANVFFNRVIRFNYWKTYHNQVTRPNKKSMWEKRLYDGFPLLGFKFQCSGRFSRKQRASAIWFRETKIPLNTLSAIIDYGFYSIPLRNSAAGVKIWLYKTHWANDFYFRLN
jgi:hypothetical protein